MKKHGISILVCTTLIFSAFLLGLFLGRNTGHGPVQISGYQASPPAAAAASISTDAAVSQEPATGVLDLNQADLDQLMSLPGIGYVIAQRILEYREASGGFQSVEELLYVEGIGTKRLEDILDYVMIGE